MIALFKDVFSWLPLATVVDERVLVCHGGISDTTDLKMIAKVDRHRVDYVLLCSVTGAIFLDLKIRFDTTVCYYELHLILMVTILF